MYAHKKLLFAVILISVFATFFSLTVYLTTVSQSSHAMSREELIKLNQQLRGEIGRKLPASRGVTQSPVKSNAPLDAFFTSDKTTVKSSGNVDLKISSNNADRAILTVYYKNTSGVILKGTKLFLLISSKSPYAFGDPLDTGVKRLPASKSGLAAFDLPELKPGQSGQARIPLFVQSSGEVSISAELLVADYSGLIVGPITIYVR